VGHSFISGMNSRKPLLAMSMFKGGGSSFRYSVTPLPTKYSQKQQAGIDAWIVADDRLREEALLRIVTSRICFRDCYSLLDGIADVSAHIGAAQRFMPGIGLQRKGEIRHCQGTVLADWIAMGGDGQERMSGTSVFVFSPEVRIDSVTSFMNLPRSA